MLIIDRFTRLLRIARKLFILKLADVSSVANALGKGTFLKLADVSSVANALGKRNIFDRLSEMGVNIQQDYMIRYELDQESGSISTDEEQIIIGFATQEKKGLLMHIRDASTTHPEYISVEVNNNGAQN